MEADGGPGHRPAMEADGGPGHRDGRRSGGSKGALLAVLSVLGVLLVAWKQGGHGSSRLRAAGQELARHGSELRAGAVQAAHTEQQLALAKRALVRTAAARLADLKKTPHARQPPRGQSLAGVSNAGQECWLPCGGQQGICSWCGPFGMCCRYGFGDTSGGCDGTIGVQGDPRHVCAATETSSSHYDSDPDHYPEVCVCVCVCVCARVCVCVCAYIHAFIHAFMHTYMHTGAQAAAASWLSPRLSRDYPRLRRRLRRVHAAGPRL